LPPPGSTTAGSPLSFCRGRRIIGTATLTPDRRGIPMRTLRPVLAVTVLIGAVARLTAGEPLPDTKPLTLEGDLAAQMVAGIDKYLMREIAASVEKRKEYWKPDFSSPDAYAKSVQPNRERLKKILGVVDARVPFKDLEYVGTTEQPALVAETDA